MEMTPEELEYAIKQAVLSRDDKGFVGFVTMLDESGNLYRQYDDGHREKIEIDKGWSKDPGPSDGGEVHRF